MRCQLKFWSNIIISLASLVADWGKCSAQLRRQLLNCASRIHTPILKWTFQVSAARFPKQIS